MNTVSEVFSARARDLASEASMSETECWTIRATYNHCMTMMTSTERRATVSLASIYALRMLGLFLVLPVFALEAAKYPGGNDPAWVGFTMGIYGLTQGVLQIPFGMASDKLGRKRVIIFGLVVFAIGSFVAAAADSLTGLMIGRAIQGAGAVSAAVTALLADLTRDEVRTKSMALIGMSIGLMFALSLVVAPILVSYIGLAGLFTLTGVLTVLAMGVVKWWTPAEPKLHKVAVRAPLLAVLKQPALARLNFGVFALHAVQLSMWVSLPSMLVAAGLAKAEHWHIYLPAVLASFVLMGGVFPLERRGYLRGVFLFAIGLIVAVQLALFVRADSASLGYLGAVLFIFFCGFNVLEATQPSLVTKVAPPELRGTALGVYNTLQSLGLFAGGFMGGALVKWGGHQAVFGVAALVMLAWLAVAWGMKAQAPKAPH
jgi:MFS family permease